MAGLPADPEGRPWCPRFLTTLWGFSGMINASAICVSFLHYWQCRLPRPKLQVIHDPSSSSPRQSSPRPKGVRKSIPQQRQHLFPVTGTPGRTHGSPPGATCHLQSPGRTVLTTLLSFPCESSKHSRPCFREDATQAPTGRGPQCSGDFEKHRILGLVLAPFTQSSGRGAKDREFQTTSPKFFQHDKPGMAQEPSLRSQGGAGR